MGAGAHPLYRHGDSVVHRAPAEVKIVCLLVFVLAVVATPREMFWPFAVYAAIVVVVWRLARIPVRWILAADVDRGAVPGARRVAAVRRGW